MRELPCELCGVFTREDCLEPAPECCARERLVCVECVQRIEDEERAEHEQREYDARDHISAKSLRLMR